MSFAIVRRYWLRALVALGLVALGYLWGHVAVTRGVFPYPQYIDLKLATFGPDADPLALQDKERPASYREQVDFFAAAATQADIVMVGDSILGRVQWRDWLPGVEISNRAIPGDYAAWLPDRLDSVIAARADRAILLVGINDAVAGRSAETIHRDILTTVAGLDDAGIAVTVLSPLPCTASADYCLDANRTIAALDAMLATNPGPNARFVDLRPVLAPGGALREEFSEDGTHLNPRGVEALVRALPADLHKTAN
ncbi:GDSL-type esterase/lipase family protein [Citromicrobium bathyomarinum]|uniref:GDSL-type esterase/lipase family protein n=1 Tax=Citromicrobium bathyomarinum TaxID=72174 RepID=UPI001E574850|nr:hypothetical protein [Citromicrobium bathyomarinum]